MARVTMDSHDAMEQITQNAILVAHEKLPKIADAKEKEYGIIYSVSGPGPSPSDPCPP